MGIEKDDAAPCERALELSEKAQFSLPGDFEYLAHYIAGKASVHLAASEVPRLTKGEVNTHESTIRYRASKHAATARHRLLQATSLAPEFAPAHERLARHYAHCGHWADALLAADEVVRRMPRSSAALAMRAECYRALHQPDSTRDDLEDAVDLAPRDAALRCQLAQVLIELGEYDEAVESCQNALLGNTQDLRDSIHYHLGIAHRKSGNLEKAQAEFTTAKALGWPAALCDAELAACGRRDAGSTYSVHARLLDVSADDDETNVTVFVTMTGEKYHRGGCRHTSRSKFPMPLDEAARQYGPCAHCRPPTR